MTSTIHARSARSTITNNSGLAKISFLRTTTELLKRAMTADRNEINRIKQELSLIECGQLFIHQNGESFYFGCFDKASGKESGITGKPDRVHALARRKYLESKVRLLESVSTRFEGLLDELESLTLRAVKDGRLDRFYVARLDLCRILFSNEQNDWLDEVYTPDPYHRESLCYPTAGGIMTRSKSEARIGSMLESIGLPYRSDNLVEIRNVPSNQAPFRDTYFADFKTPNLSGGITIHEHLGAFQMEHYQDNALKRLNDYHNFTIYELPGRPVAHNEFTWSFESDLRDPALMKGIIQRMLLPGYPFL